MRCSWIAWGCSACPPACSTLVCLTSALKPWRETDLESPRCLVALEQGILTLKRWRRKCRGRLEVANEALRALERADGLINTDDVAKAWSTLETAMGRVDTPDEPVTGWRWAANDEEVAWGVLGNVNSDDDHRRGGRAWEANQQGGGLTTCPT
jgi:hypothetical protein